MSMEVIIRFTIVLGLAGGSVAKDVGSAPRRG